MIETQAIECSQGEQINSFLAGRLSAESRKLLVAHLGVCEQCAALVRDLRQDERLARIPLTPAERKTIRVIVQGAREEVDARLASDRRKEAFGTAPEEPVFTGPRLTLPAPGLRKAVWLAVGAASVLGVIAWWLFEA